jgi:hypothetical protein
VNSVTKQDELNDQAVNRARFETIKTVENEKTHFIASVVQTQRRVCRATSIMHIEGNLELEVGILNWGRGQEF